MSARTAWPKVPAAFVQQNLVGHKLLGLALCAVLYLVSLSGTATVFYVEIQRWETAEAPDVAAVSPQALAAAVADARTAFPKARNLGIIPPTAELPRLLVGTDETERAYDRQGRYAGAGDHPIVEGLTALHYALSLPTAVGLPIVGLAGLGLAALLIGGLAAHPRIFRDAFLWRWRSGLRLSRADLHNRLGVWASPFHLTIALSGAVIGLASLILFAASAAFDGGNVAKTTAPLMGPWPVQSAHGQVGDAALIRALQTVQRRQPGAQPSYIALNNLGTDHESLTVSVEVPERLVYGETYEFDGAGGLAAVHGLTNGPIGKQVYASLYKLHFGSFGGAALKWAYVLLGAGLCLMCSSGMELWLIKSEQAGRAYPRLRRLWAGFVWAAPAAMALAALGALTLAAPFAGVFWTTVVVGSLAALGAADHRLLGRVGRRATGATLLALAAAHAAVFGAGATGPSALGVNLSLVLIGATLWVIAARAAPRMKKPSPGGERALETESASG